MANAAVVIILIVVLLLVVAAGIVALVLYLRNRNTSPTGGTAPSPPGPTSGAPPPTLTSSVTTIAADPDSITIQLTPNSAIPSTVTTIQYIVQLTRNDFNTIANTATVTRPVSTTTLTIPGPSFNPPYSFMANTATEILKTRVAAKYTTSTVQGAYSNVVNVTPLLLQGLNPPT